MTSLESRVEGARNDYRPAECPLPTRWTSRVDPKSVLPEYPRPQLVRRGEWINLNGIYEGAIRPASEGQPEAFDLKILVPFPVESSLSGVGRRVTSADRIWYRRSFEAPEARSGHTWILRFGAVDWRADVWLDHRPLGRHEGGYDPFSFDLGPLGGEHLLVVAVWDPTEAGPQPRGKQMLRPNVLQAPFFYTPASGIWQTVWLEQVPVSRIEGLKLVPKGSTLSVCAHLVGSSGSERIRVIALEAGAEVASARGLAGQDLVLEICRPRRWSPDDPFLYELELVLEREGAELDRVESYFGLRDVSVDRDASGVLRIHLNGEPIFLHGLLDQGYWPDGIYTAPSDEALRFDLEETKRLGFNFVRKHVKVEPARWYWHCDRLGLLVFQDMPSGDSMTLGLPIGGLGAFDATRWLGARGVRRSAESAAIFERELEAMMSCLGNFPSVVGWVIFNEGWGQFQPKRFARQVAEADPTRIVDAVSGWVDAGVGHLRDVHVYHPGPRLPGRRDPLRAEVLGEWGGLGLEVTGHRWPKRAFAYKTFRSVGQLTDEYLVRLDTLARLADQAFAAAVYTQTTDVEGEVNGLLTYDREVLKFDEVRLVEANRKLLQGMRRGSEGGRSK